MNAAPGTLQSSREPGSNDTTEPVLVVPVHGRGEQKPVRVTAAWMMSDVPANNCG